MVTNRRHASVGIVVPAFNVEPWLDAMLESLRAQTYTSWRAVVVDDGSSDGTIDVARRHAEGDERIEVASNPWSGPGARLARIHGRSLLPPDVDYLYFPDADDVLEPRLVERLAGRLDARTDAVAAFCHFSVIDERGEPLESRVRPRNVLTRRWSRALAEWEEETPFASLYTWAPALEGLTMFRRSTYDEVGGFEQSPAWASHTAVDLLLRLSLRGPVLFIPDGLYLRRRRPGQMSSRLSMLEANGDALKRLWSLRAATDPEIRRCVTQGEFLLCHRLIPGLRLRRARDLVRRGNLVGAAPRVVLAAVSYRWRPPRGSA
jgi:glycosyltransferase involved in cell wall biosynthesis